MEKHILDDIKEFFESYEIAHKLINPKNKRFLSVTLTTSIRGVVTIRVIEKIEKQNDNIICDIRIEGNKITMLFKLVDQARKIQHIIKSIAKPYYVVTCLGANLKIIIANPILKDVQETFIVLEKYCRRRE